METKLKSTKLKGLIVLGIALTAVVATPKKATSQDYICSSFCSPNQSYDCRINYVGGGSTYCSFYGPPKDVLLPAPN